MEYFESTEHKQALNKQLIFSAVRQLLGEYIDEKYHLVTKDSSVDFRVTANIDYLMASLLDEDESFTINSFLKKHFHNDKVLINNCKNIINKIVIFDDLVELLIVLSVYNRQNLMSTQLKQQRLQLCLSYYNQLKKVNELHSTCLKLIFCLQKEQLKVNYPKYGIPADQHKIKETLEEVQVLHCKIDAFQVKTDSKKSMVECLDLLFKHSSMTIGEA